MKIEQGGDEITDAVFTTSSGRLNIDISADRETVSDGTTQTYEVKADLEGFGNNDSLSVGVKDLENSFTVGGDTYANVDSAFETFIWTDNSGTDDNANVEHWFNGFKVPGLDTDYLSMTD
jgi:hypothetical protein